MKSSGNSASRKVFMNSLNPSKSIVCSEGEENKNNNFWMFCKKKKIHTNPSNNILLTKTSDCIWIYWFLKIQTDTPILESDYWIKYYFENSQYCCNTSEHSAKQLQVNSEHLYQDPEIKFHALKFLD